MSILARLVAVAGLVLVSACGGAPNTPSTGAAGGWTVADSSVRFGPDIERTASGTNYNDNFVWDGYNGGNRKRQVVGLFKAAIGDATGNLSGPQNVMLKVVVTRFHAMTPSAQTWCCGEHNIVANLEVVDPESGSVLASGNDIYLGRVALGGLPGIIATAAGRDQTVRVREGIATGIANWLAGL